MVRRLERTSEVLAEIHGEIGEVLYDNHVVFVGHLADDLQLLVGEAEPSRIVRVGIDHRGNIAFGKMRFQGLTQSLATVFVYVERLIFIAHNGYLLFLHGNPGSINKMVSFPGVHCPAVRKEAYVPCMEPVTGTQHSGSISIFINALIKREACFFTSGSSVDVRVDRRYTVTKGFDLSVYAYLSGFQARYAISIWMNSVPVSCSNCVDMATTSPDSRFPKIGKSKAIDNPSGCLIVYRSIFMLVLIIYGGQKYEIYRFVLNFFILNYC